jgi:hypothetical protein
MEQREREKDMETEKKGEKYEEREKGKEIRTQRERGETRRQVEGVRVTEKERRS